MKAVRLGSICADFSCAHCCKNTEMLLSEEDITRIKLLGYKESDFCVHTPDGFRTIRNVNDQCFFLLNNQCTIYSDRPQGCRFYPIIFDSDLKKAVLDEECPLISTIPQSIITRLEKDIKRFILKIFKEKKIVDEIKR